MGIQSKVGISRYRKTIDRERIEHLGSLDLGWSRPGAANLCETIGDEEDEDDEGTVCGAFDFKVAEKRVGSEEV